MARVEEALRAVVHDGDMRIDAVTSHLAHAGGKRIRPALTLLTSYLGPDPENTDVEKSALVVELTHLATLYHDDVMDDAPMRRGVPSAQSRYSNTAAILAGDILFARASMLVAELGPTAVHLHAQTFERLCRGQLFETLGPADGADRIEHYLKVLADKTGSLIAASARYGVLSAGGASELAETVSAYGEAVGVAFQLADDVIDVLSTGEVTGKTPGTDLREGVVTMPILLLDRRRAQGTLDGEGERILHAFESGELADDAVLASVIAALNTHPVLEETQDLAREWADRAISALEPLPGGEVKDALRDFAQLTVERLS